jgi:histidyl-tRNA synthetase
MADMQTPRGTRDFLPEEMMKRQFIFETVRSVFERFGFSPMETPAFESWDLLSKKGAGGKDIKNDIYYFKDKGERELGLRFDLTVPMCRVVANNPNLIKPFKRYQIGRVWRYDRPQAGRFREFWQADIDIVGSTSVECELECLMVAVNAIMALGFEKFKVKLNNRKILNGIVQSVGIEEKKITPALRALDKLSKIGEKGVLSELREDGIGPTKARDLLKAVKASGSLQEMLDEQKKKLKEFSESQNGIRELEDLIKSSETYGIKGKIELDFSLVRGLEYYTGPIFEIVIESKANVGSVSGGGRYDNMIELYNGKWTPAVGISLGIERLYEIMQAENMFKSIPKTTTKVFVVAVDDSMRQNAFLTAQALRNAGINTQIDLMTRNMKKQLEYAGNAGIPYVVLIGENEFKEKSFSFKNMKTGDQKQLILEDIIKAVKEEKAA